MGGKLVPPRFDFPDAFRKQLGDQTARDNGSFDIAPLEYVQEAPDAEPGAILARPQRQIVECVLRASGHRPARRGHGLPLVQHEKHHRHPGTAGLLCEPIWSPGMLRPIIPLVRFREIGESHMIPLLHMNLKLLRSLPRL
jgi:hypothetical protein